MAELTPKQEAFALAYHETGNASAAYRRAYDAKRMKPETVQRNAHALVQNDKIATRLASLTAAVLEIHEITIEERIKRYAELSRLAQTNNDLGAAIRAEDSITKIAGLFSESRRNERDPVADLGREDRQRLKALLLARKQEQGAAGLH